MALDPMPSTSADARTGGTTIIYALVFLGFFGGALVSPALSPMFLHPVENGVLPEGTSMARRAFLLGVAMGMMRLGEFWKGREQEVFGGRYQPSELLEPLPGSPEDR